MMKPVKRKGTLPYPATEQKDNAQNARCQSQYSRCMAIGNDLLARGEIMEAERSFQCAEHYLRLMNNASFKQPCHKNRKQILNRRFDEDPQIENEEKIGKRIRSTDRNIDNDVQLPIDIFSEEVSDNIPEEFL